MLASPIGAPVKESRTLTFNMPTGFAMPMLETGNLIIISSRDSLNKLNQMMRNGGFASRGVTIDHMIDSMWELTTDVTVLLRTSEQGYIHFLLAYCN
jgi:hypothetical protein